MNKVLLSSLFLSAISVALPTLAEEKTTVSTTDTSPYKLESRRDYAAGVKSCRGALIAPSWVLTAKHCLGSKKANNLGKHGWVNLSYTDELGQRKPVSYNAKAIFRHPFKDIGLMQLSEPVFEYQIEPALLLATPIKKRHGKFLMKKVSGNVFLDIPVRAGKRNNSFISKPNRRGGAGSSGAPWVFTSDTVGDVIFSVTHGSGRGAQVAYVKGWINETVEKNDPTEQLYWVTLETVFPERFSK